ncbi:MAG TPA: CheR family methyltransferase [Dinghuibacter sp.]|jgi:chemotaxis protein methyltransferase CheR|uniref:CheR family methyltransferase n=1 Tax=Dinghuibacter sp. TaxID=2024697 RepID=UPI002C83DC32|nr:CheR family methyltransferase [Dinghuibacter sp.]HTJ13931.1 CheR family methyltransferase [Dinghuibacter sp.]
MEKFAELPNEHMDKILILVDRRFGYDFTGYARASIRRRILGFMGRSGIYTASELEYHLLNDETCFPRFLQYVTVNVTEMFRDPGFYKALRENVIPQLASYPFIKIWHAGCSTGEEVYSMAILLQEEGLLERTKLYATDINSYVLGKAKQGIFPLRYMQDYTRNYRNSGGKEVFSSYYTAKYDNVLFDASLKKNMVFALHNLTADGSFNEFNLILCRNVMIYFDRAFQQKCVDLFRQSLCLLGYLGLGTKESLAFNDNARAFEAVDQRWRTYRRIK